MAKGQLTRGEMQAFTSFSADMSKLASASSGPQADAMASAARAATLVVRRYTDTGRLRIEEFMDAIDQVLAICRKTLAGR